MNKNIAISQLSRDNNTIIQNLDYIMNTSSENVNYLTTKLLRTQNINYD